MLIPNRSENLVPVRSAKVRRSAQGCNCVLLCTNVLNLLHETMVRTGWQKERLATNNDVVHVVLLDAGREVDVNFNAVLGILLLDGVQQ
jgi:hypothetical protein